jgi:hypothetical protein
MINIKKYTKARSLLKKLKRPTKIDYAVSVLVIILTLVGLLVTTRARETPVQIILRISRITFHVASDQHPPLYITIPTPYGLSHVENIRSKSPYLSSDSAIAPPQTISTERPSLAVSQIPVHSGSWVTVENYINSGFSLYLRSQSGALTFVHTNFPITLLGQNQSSTILPAPAPDTPKVFSINLDNLTSPLVLLFKQSEPAQTCSVETDPRFIIPSIERVSVDGIGFGSESIPSLSLFTSSIISGSIKFLAIERTRELARSDTLKLSLASASIAELRILPCYISVIITAVAKDLRTGSGEHLLDLRPTYLEVAFRELSLSFVASCIISLWGFLWGLKELFVKSK